MTLKQQLLTALAMPLSFLVVGVITWTVLTSTTVGADQEWSTPDAKPVPAWTADAAALAVTYDCHVEGLGEGAIPAHAVIVLDEQVRLVSFDRGWAIVEGTKPGTLVSVCAL